MVWVDELVVSGIAALMMISVMPRKNSWTKNFGLPEVSATLFIGSATLLLHASSVLLLDPASTVHTLYFFY